jgi:steroid delta-isomerase-like uncharacterized protein
VPILGDVATKRVELVRDHVEAENAGDYTAALLTFKHPRYEYVATDEVYDGPDEVMAHWQELDRAFPDQLVEIYKLHSADDTVLMEAVARGTHTGLLRGLPPTGRKYELPFLGIFVFEGDGLVCERVYLDTNTMMRALGVARDPLSVGGRLGMVAAHPFAIGRGLIRGAIGR